MGLASITNNIITDTGVSPSGLISGSGATGQVAYWNGTNSQTGDNNLVWNAASIRLGIGRTSTARRLEIQQGVGGIASALGIYKGDGTLPFIMGIESQSTDDTILAATVGIRFYTGSTIGGAATLPTNERMRLYGATGNLVIGGTFASDGGQRLQVYGDTLLRGSGADSTTTALSIQNSSSTALFSVRNDGLSTFNGNIQVNSALSINFTDNILLTSSAAFPRMTMGGSSTGPGCISIGKSSSATGNQSFALGGSAVCSGAYAVVIGYAASSSGTGSITLGYNAEGVANSFVAGSGYSTDSQITNVYFGSGVRHITATGNGVDYAINGSGAGNGFNLNGGSVTIAGGRNTGSGVAGDVILSTSSTSTSSNVLQGLTQRMLVKGTSGNVLIGGITDDTINKLQVTGTAVAGSNTSTVGSVILRGYYTSGYLTTFGTDASSGGPMLSYAVESAQNSTEGAFVSSTPNVDTPRSAYTVSANHRWYTAPTSTTSVGTAISLTKHMELFNSGNLVLGGAAEVAGSKLQVIGNAFIKGSTNDATAVALTVQNSDGTNLFRVQNDNSIFLHGTTYIGTSTTRARIYAGGDFSESAHMTGPNNRQVLRIVSGIIANNISDNSSVFEVNQNITSNATVTNVSNTLISGTYTAATGSVNFNGLLIANTINQSGTANGAIRGLYVNPSFTTVTQNWRSIEWSNNTGWGIYGTGVAPNQMNGRLTVSAVIPQTGTNGFSTFANNRIGLFGAQSIDVPTTAAFNQGTVTAAGTSAQYLTFNGNTTVGGDALLAGSVHINSVQFATTGTVTMNNSAAGGQRTMSVMQLQMQKAGIVGGTINRGSTLYLFGVYPTTSTGGTVTFTEYAGLRIGNLMEWLDGTPPNTTVALTNKWGIYQEGPADPNYFAGAVGVGITTPNPSAKLQVDSTTQGFLPPRMTTAQRNAITAPAAGLIVYDTSLNIHYGYNGTTWNAFY